MSNRKLALIILFLFSMLCPMFIYSSVIYTEQNTNIFNPDIAVALGNGNAGTSTIGINGTSASVNVTAAQNWFSNFQYREKITFNNSAISENLINFTVPIIFNSSNADFWGHVQTNGNDTRFVDADNTTELYYELETFNHTTDNMVAWVRVPQIDASSTTDYIWIYYGNGMVDFDSYSRSSSNAWDSNYVAVYHFKDGSGSKITDSTLQKNATLYGSTSHWTNGQIGGTYNFDGSADYALIAASSSFDCSTYTIEAWAKPNSTLAWTNIMGQNDTSTGPSKFQFSAGSSAANLASDFGGGAYPWHSLEATSALTNGAWNSYVDRIDMASTNQSLWKNGAIVASQTQTTYPCTYANGSAIGIGADAFGAYKFKGTIDELRFSKTARSANWIKACYQYQVDGSKFTVASEETRLCIARAYYDYVDNTSNVDSSADLGTHSNFTGQQYGPDAINDTLTEANLGGVASYYPSATTSGSYPWTNPSNAYSSNNQYATAVATIPTYRSRGAMAHSTTSAITPALPASMVANDIVILVACCYTGGTIAITAAGSITTWNALTGTPVDVTAGDKLYVWWGRYSSGSTGPTLTPTSGDHIVGRTVAFYNCYAGGSPIDVSATGSETTSDTSFSFATGLTTTYNNEVCVCICTTTYDPTSDSTTAFGTMTNGNLAGINERMDNDVNEGNGGGFGLDHGTLVANGAMGTWASTLVGSTPKSYIAFALRSNVPDNDFDQIYGTFGVTGSYAITQVEIGYEAYSSVAQQLDIYTSSNGGSSWNTIHTTANLGTSDPNSYTYIDVTADTSWTWTLLNNANFMVKVVSHWLSGTPTWSIDTLIVRVTQVSYSLALEEQFTAVDYNAIYEELCVATGPLSAESLAVQVWNGSWNTVVAALTANAWNNVSVSSFVSSTELYIRFVGTSESSDTTQSTWQIDATLLNVKTDTYDYILSAASKKAYAQNITLTLYSYSNINRLSNCTVWFHDGTQSVQIAIINGVVAQSSGANYALPAGSSRYIATYVQQSSSGTSTLSIRLEAKTQNSIVYACLIELWVT